MRYVAQAIPARSEWVQYLRMRLLTWWSHTT